MKFKLSFLTLVGCAAALGIVWVLCTQPTYYPGPHVVDFGNGTQRTAASGITMYPSSAEIALRMAWAGPLAIAATLAMFWVARNLRTW
jgi:hypothetical protein